MTLKPSLIIFSNIVALLGLLFSQPAVADWSAPTRYAGDFGGHAGMTFAEVPHHANLNPQGPMTVEAWVLARSYQTFENTIDTFPNNVIVNKYYDDFGTGYALMLIDGKPTFSMAISAGLGNERLAMGADDVQLDYYHHIAGSWDGQFLRVFLDGIEVGSEPMASMTNDSTEPLIIGRRHRVGQYFWDGLIAEIRISAGARYTSDFTPPHTFEADGDALAVWRFDEGAGTVVGDASGFGYHGALVNGGWLHSIQPLFLDATQGVVDIGGSATSSVDPVRLREEFAYSLEFTGAAEQRPGVSFEHVLLYAESADATGIRVADMGGPVPMTENSAGEVTVGVALVDSDPLDNSGTIRAVFRVDGAAAVPTPADASAASRSRLHVLGTPSAGVVRFRIDTQGLSPDEAPGIIGIYTAQGARVAEVAVEDGAATWNGRDTLGRRVPSGTYFAESNGNGQSRFVLVR